MSEHDSDHNPHVAHHYDTERQQFESGKLGMWVFLVTEILLFGGLFCWYAIYRAHHPEVFIYASQYLDKLLGATNTVILICSSLTMAWAVRAAQMGDNRLVVRMIVVTLLCACGFLGIKAVEYNHKLHAGLTPGKHYAPHHEETAKAPGAAIPDSDQPDADQPDGAEPPVAPAKADDDKSVIAPAARGPEGLDFGDGKEEEAPVPDNVALFFSIYWVMTGLHGVHVLAGMGVMIWLLRRAKRGEFGPHNFLAVDCGALYWHVVDLVWIFLFPLLYLID